MIKTFLKSILIGLGLFFAPLAFASTIDFSPNTVNVEPGKTFTVQVYVNPQAATYSAKVELKYPADLLQVSSFTIDDAWMALKQSGYDATDNINGVLLKSGGYPGGFSAKTLFGTVIFSAVKDGSATISVGSNTNIPNASNVNTLTASPSVAVSIVSPVITPPTPPIQPQSTPTPTPTVKTTPKTNPVVQPQPTPTPSEETPEPPTEAQPEETFVTNVANDSQASLISVLGNALSLGTDNLFVGFLVILAIIAIIFYGYKFYQKKKRK